MTNKVHTTNYFDTFIEVAEDTKATSGTIPPSKDDKKTIAGAQYELLAKNDYQFTSDDILFQVFANRNDLLPDEYEQARQEFFSKGQACFRTSPLTKNYGFGVHFDSAGKMAIYGMETPEYERFLTNGSVKKIKAVKSKR